MAAMADIPAMPAGQLCQKGNYSKVSIISTGRSRLLEFENEIVLVV